MAESKRRRYEILRSQLESERSSFISHWRDLGDYILPRRPRFFTTDVNRGDRRNQKIIDSTATLAARTLQSGMMGGVTSPARPWFRLTTPDPGLSEYASVKDWLHTVTQRMIYTLLKSNIYNVLPITYADLGVFGTAAMSIEEDMENVIHCHSFPVGSYTIGKDARGAINVFHRDFRMTVRQVVERFSKRKPNGDIDWSNISDYVRNQWETDQTEAWVEICHIIEPNPEYDPNKLHSKYKKFSSCYYERGSTNASSSNYLTDSDPDRLLSEKGYDLFPILVPRWGVTGEDVYGTSCPGMDGLGDIKQLQLGEKRGAEAIEKKIRPPMVAPTSMRNTRSSILPGDVTYTDVREGQQGFRPAHEVNISLVELENKQDQIRRRIQRCFYEDLFLMLATSDRRDFTAREIDERHEEKLLALGPVLEQLNQDLLDPLIDILFDIMNRQGLLPEPPQELQGVPLKVEYLSVMAQAQKYLSLSGIERYAQFAGQVAGMDPNSIDKTDIDQLLDVYGDITSVPPGIIRTDDQVAAIRAQKQKAAQAQATAQMVEQGASAAKNLSQADLSGDNALTAMLQGGQPQ
jgi:hypothetical protein